MKTDNFGFTYKTGILLPISSLPSKYGIGSFGKSAYEFIDFLKETNQTVWQVLPLNPTSVGDSPYQSPCSNAGNPYFIDLDILHEEGLVTLEELDKNRHEYQTIDYGWLFETRYKLLKKAFIRFNKNDDYYRFVETNKEWLYDYSLFMVLKLKHQYAEWTKWERDFKDINLARKLMPIFMQDMEYWMFIQFKFYEQWNKLKSYANENGIKIIGDIPIYVALDSVDVWKNPDEFLLDENYQPSLVAGCPPDDFAKDGQLWGNPIYNWKHMEDNGFSFWIKRLSTTFKMYDIVRIDHFRGFAGYYAIPSTDETAINGKWYTAPGVKLFKKIKEEYPDSMIIAEDLGFITDDVRELLKETGFPGMKVLQFAFYTNDSEYLPRCFETTNSVCYTATHDSDTTNSFIETIENDVLERFKKETKAFRTKSKTDKLIELALSSISNLVVIPIQDYLNLKNDEGRINTPSTKTGNWVWRIDSYYKTTQLINKIKKLTIKYNRC